MADTTKPMSEKDMPQAIRAVYNDVDKTLSTNGFLVGQVGNKVVVTISTTTVTNDTETYAFSDSSSALYSLKCIYTDGTRNTLLSAERIS